MQQRERIFEFFYSGSWCFPPGCKGILEELQKHQKSHLWESWWLHTWYGTGWCCHVPLADGLSSWQQEEGLAAWQGLLLKARAFPLHPQYQRMRTQRELLTKKPGTNVHIHDQTQYLIILYPWLFLIFKKISFFLETPLFLHLF